MRKIRAALVLAVMLAACHQNDHQQASEMDKLPANKPMEDADLRSRIDPGASWTETQVQFPKDYSEFGSDEMKRINDLTYWAGIAALTKPVCDRVQQSAFSADSEPGNLSWFVDCDDGGRVVVTEDAAIEAKDRWSRVVRPPK